MWTAPAVKFHLSAPLKLWKLKLLVVSLFDRINKLTRFSISSLFTLSDSCVPPPLWGDFVEVLHLLHRQTRSEPPWPQGCSPSWWTVYETKVFFHGWSPTWAGPPSPPSPSLPFSLSASSPSTWLPGNLRKENWKELLYTHSLTLLLFSWEP